MKSVLSADSADFYNRRLAWLVVPLTAAWLAWTFGVRTFLWPPSHSLASVSRDAGLQMALVAPFPWWMLWGHSLAGSLLLAGVLAQKQFVCRMAGSFAGSTEASLKTHLAHALHRWNGYACLAAMTVMAGMGLAMAPYSSWNNFSAFSVGFAAPWLLWATALYVSAKMRRWGAHRLVGNQVLAGCLTVPLARLGGAGLQRAMPQLGEDWGYYCGIGLVTIAMAVWQMAELYTFFSAPCAPGARRANKAHKT